MQNTLAFDEATRNESPISSITSFEILNTLNSDEDIYSLIKGQYVFNSSLALKANLMYAGMTQKPQPNHQSEPAIRHRRDLFVLGEANLRYSVENLAFELGIHFGDEERRSVTILGGSASITYVQRSDESSPDYQDSSLPPFWIKSTVLDTVVSSDKLDNRNPLRGYQIAFHNDAYFKVDESLLLGFTARFLTHHNQDGYLNQTLRAKSLHDLDLKGLSVPGLPHFIFGTDPIYKIAELDYVLPSYRAYEINLSGVWVHTLGLGWRHQFTPLWGLNFNYEYSIRNRDHFNGFLLLNRFTLPSK